MSGDNRSEDDPDFLDDEFVVEGLSDNEPQDDLDQLLAMPQPPVAAPVDGDAAAADALFTDHVADVVPSQSFGDAGTPFAEDAPSNWNGAELELEDPDATPETLLPPVAEEALPDEGTLDGEPAWADATADGAGPGDFLGLSSDAGDAFATADDAPAYDAPTDEASADEAAGTDEAFAAAELEPEPAYADDAAASDAVTDEATAAPVLAGPAPAGSRWGVILTSIAASLSLIAAGAVVVLRPQWLGIELAPKPFAVAQVDRPHIEVGLLPPAAPVVAVAPTPVPLGTDATSAVAAVTPVAPAPAPAVTPTVVAPSVAVEPSVPVAPVLPVAAAPQPEATPPANPPAAVATVAWPVAKGEPMASRSPTRRTGTLVRIGDDVMLGEADAAAAERRVVDGVIPGVKAFAQLRNGNFFIGSVKAIDGDQVTLRTQEGEVSLVRAELTRLTGLGSADYEALQKATDGFVRLTNSNKLVGGILSQIADDHVVLEFRSNRVILPRSAVGEVVQGQQGDGIRFGLTSEEDDWLRKVAEREIGKPAAPAKPEKPNK